MNTLHRLHPAAHRKIRHIECKGCFKVYVEMIAPDSAYEIQGCPFCLNQDDFKTRAYVHLVRTGHAIRWGTEFRYEPSGLGLARYVCLFVRIVSCESGAWYQSECKLFYDCAKPELIEKACQYVIDHPEVLTGPL